MRDLAWLIVLLALLAPRTADAGPASKWVSARVPLHARTEGGTALVPLSAPSKEHPLGTVAIFGQNVTDADVEADEASLLLRAYAWDLAAQKVIATKVIARLPSARSVVAAVRDGDRILVIAAGHHSAAGPTNVALFTIDDALEVLSREDLGIGQTPSIAISDRWIVAGFFEERTTDVQPLGTRPAIGNVALHAVVLDRTTHAVVDARVFQGTPSLLIPDRYTWLAMHALAIQGEHLYVSLPSGAAALLVQAKLPSLTPVKQRVLDGFQVLASSPIHVVGGNLVVVTPLGWRVLTPQLDLLPQKFPVPSQTMAWNAKRGMLFTSANGTALPWSTLDLDHGCESRIWAWDRPVALCDGREAEDGEPGMPMRLFRLR